MLIIKTMIGRGLREAWLAVHDRLLKDVRDSARAAAKLPADVADGLRAVTRTYADSDHLAAAVVGNIDIGKAEIILQDQGFTAAWRQSDELLYRADNTPPEIAFEEGFSPRNLSYADLLEATKNGDPSIFVGTTRNPEIAKVSDIYRRNYIYGLDVPGGIDVNATFGMKSPIPEEEEVAFPGGISRDFTVGAIPVDYPKPGQRREFQYGEFIPNPHYRPTL